jgi:hypothetical protein
MTKTGEAETLALVPGYTEHPVGSRLESSTTTISFYREL